MSWSIAAFGKVNSVATKIKEQMAIGNEAEPEKSIKQSVGEIIATALGSMSGENPVVRVEACGSQSTRDNVVVSNSLTLKIEPMYGFLD